MASRLATTIGVLVVLVAVRGLAEEKKELEVAFQPDDIFLTVRDGTPSGFAAELLALFARRESVELHYTPVRNFSDLIPSLLEGTADIAVGPLAITPERLESVDFSEVIFPAQARLFGSAKNPVTRIEDVAGKQVGVIAGSVVKQALGSCQCEVVEFSAGSTGKMASLVVEGELAALASTTDIMLPRLNRAYQGLQVGPPLGTTLELAFALPKGSSIKESLDRTLRDLKRSKIFYRLVGDHFGQDAVEIFLTGQGHGGPGSSPVSE